MDVLVATGVVLIQALVGVGVLKSILPPNDETNKVGKLNIVLNVLCLFFSLGYFMIIINKSYFYDSSIIGSALKASIVINLSYILASILTMVLRLNVDDVRVNRLLKSLSVLRIGLLSLITIGFGFYYIYFLLKFVTSGLLI